MVNKDWMTPYNTGKVLIGCLYTPKFKPHPMTQDGLRLQRALLNSRRAKPEATRMVDAMTRAVKLFDVLVDKLARRR